MKMFLDFIIVIFAEVNFWPLKLHRFILHFFPKKFFDD